MGLIGEQILIQKSDGAIISIGDDPAIRLDLPVNQFEEGGFACSIKAYKTDFVIRPDMQGGLVENGSGSYVVTDLIYGEHFAKIIWFFNGSGVYLDKNLYFVLFKKIAVIFTPNCSVMKAKRRDFLKMMGLSSGIIFVNPEDVLANEPVDFGKIDKNVYKTDVLEADVCIVGGGMAGVNAALAAARNGASVVLMQDRSRLGGNASSEIRMHISGASVMNSIWRETGILEELVLTEAVTNPQRSFEIWDYILYDKVISEEKITLLLDTILFDVETSGHRIASVSGICSNTEQIYDVKAAFYADCTGDATLAARAGAEYMHGREGIDVWNESLAVDKSDLKTMGNSILFNSRKFDKPMPFTPPNWARKFTSRDFTHRPIHSWEYGYWWIELGGMGDIVRDGQELRHELLAVVFGIWDYIKNSGNHPDSENWAMTWVGMIPGKRESRRIVGDYIMKQGDIQNPKLFKDRVAYGGWPLDDHPPQGMNRTGDAPYRSIPLKEPYSIPLRSLYCKDFENLTMAGRNISVSHVALSSTRVMATCSTLGQAIGTAMAFCNANRLTPRKLVNDSDKLRKYQQILLLDDQSLLGVVNDSPDDLARQAKIKASSETQDGRAKQVIDGINRDVGDGSTHQWRADMTQGPQWIELKLNKAVPVGEIHLTFDTGLERQLRLSGSDAVMRAQVRGPQPETVKNYIIQLFNEKESVQMIEIKGNYLRKRMHAFSGLKTDRIRIWVNMTNGDSMARIFEIRCYGG